MAQGAALLWIRMGCPFKYPRFGPKSLRAEETGGGAESRMVQPCLGKAYFSKTLKKPEV